KEVQVAFKELETSFEKSEAKLLNLSSGFISKNLERERREIRRVMDRADLAAWQKSAVLNLISNGSDIGEALQTLEAGAPGLSHSEIEALREEIGRNAREKDKLTS